MTDQAARKVTHAAAARILAERDPVIARLLDQTGPPKLARPTELHFATLVRAIVYQQLAGRAAAAIHGRLIAALDGDVRPETLITLSDESLRAVGLSRNKMASLRDLAAKVLDGTVVLSPRGLSRESDDEIVTRLSAVRGIGPWTAEMFLLFQLRRPRCLAGRRPRGPARLRTGLAGPDPDRAGAPPARRSVPALPVGGGLVLLAGRRTVRGRRRQRADPVACQAWSTSTRKRCGQA